MNKVFNPRHFDQFLKDLKGVEPLCQFTEQILKYAQKTKVQFLKSNATSDWEQLGISNLRGFAPQRRVVLVNSDGKLDWTSFYFLIHDLLHIYFYDRITGELGNEIWEGEDSFIACHLASEAFAVLSLDYFIFPKSPLKRIGLKHPFGVAAYVKSEWIQTKGQVELASQILNLYREGKSLKFSEEKKNSKALQILIDHEVGYSRKQRLYSANWWNFLNNKKVIDSPKIKFFKALDWEAPLLVRFFDELMDQSWASRAKQKNKFPKTYFNSLKRADNSIGKGADFRFQNVFSFTPSKVKTFLSEGFNKNPSFHFLAAQLLCVVRPEHRLNAKFKRDIAVLYGKKAAGNRLKNDTACRLVEHLIATLDARFTHAHYFERDVFYLS